MNCRMELTVTGTEHGEVQGNITLKSGRTVRFRSVLELLRLLSEATAAETRAPE